MKLKPAIRKSHPDGFQHQPCLFLTPAVDDAIVRVSLERIVRKGPLHPRIERIMQKEIRQERACYSPYAKDNLHRLAIGDLWSARRSHRRQLIGLEPESSVG